MLPKDFHNQVLQTIDRWEMISRGARVGIAVSGGADSVAMLRTLVQVAPAFGWNLVVLHANHKLRGAESDGDALFVETLAVDLDLPFDKADLPVKKDGNLEQEARDARYGWFAHCKAKHSLQVIAVGHTRSDQAETVLFRFLRGSGGAGLAGIHPKLKTGVVRPLLGVTRQHVRDYLREIGQPWREDASNQDLSFDRNRIRLELLPQLARDWNGAIETTLSQTAEWALAEEEYWEKELAELASRLLEHRADRSVILDARRLSALPVAVARRLLRHAIHLIRGDLRGIEWSHTEQIRDLCAQEDGTGRFQIPGVDVMRSFEWVRLAPPNSYAGERHLTADVTVPGEIFLPDSNVTLKLQVQTADYLYNESVNCLDWDRIRGPLTLRTWQPGDGYRQTGHGSEVKLKTLFQELRVPLWDRRTWPILTTDSDAIVWARRFGAAEEFAAGPSTRRLITVAEQPSGLANTASPKLESEPNIRRL